MKKCLLLCLLAGSAILAPVLTYANTPSELSSGPICFTTPTGEYCVMPPQPFIPPFPFSPPTN